MAVGSRAHQRAGGTLGGVCGGGGAGCVCMLCGGVGWGTCGDVYDFLSSLLPCPARVQLMSAYPFALRSCPARVQVDVGHQSTRLSTASLALRACVCDTLVVGRASGGRCSRGQRLMACGPAVAAARDPADHGVSSYTPWVEVERLLLPRATVLCALACAVCAHVVSSLVCSRCVRAMLCLLVWSTRHLVQPGKTALGRRRRTGGYKR
jgi:hypothetical protein